MLKAFKFGRARQVAVAMARAVAVAEKVVFAPVEITERFCGAGVEPSPGTKNDRLCGIADKVAACGATMSETGTVTEPTPARLMVKVPL